MNSKIAKNILLFLPVFFAAVTALTLTGCQTTGDDNDSDIPWNTPQSWESAPSIPGLEQGM